MRRPLLHGAYGLFVTDPAGSIWRGNETGAFLGTNATDTAAAIIVPFGRSFRGFAVTMLTTDQHMGRDIIPYYEQIAGTTDDEDSPEGSGTVPHPRRRRARVPLGAVHVGRRDRPRTQPLAAGRSARAGRSTPNSWVAGGPPRQPI